MSIRTYSKLITLPTFEERYEYLKLGGLVGKETFGYDRFLNQQFYRDPEWIRIRREVILRDDGLDLGMEDHVIYGKILVHHMNPITAKDILDRNPKILDPEFLISVSQITHDAIHFGNSDILIKNPIERVKNDTCPWKK